MGDACFHTLSVGKASILGAVGVRVMVNCFRKGSVMLHTGTVIMKKMRASFRMMCGSE